MKNEVLCIRVGPDINNHTGGRSLLLENEGVYHHLMLYEDSMEKIEVEIVRDLNRTYPGHVYYQQRQGPGQRSLFNVLKAYSVYDKRVREIHHGNEYVLYVLVIDAIALARDPSHWGCGCELGGLCARYGLYCWPAPSLHV